MFKALMHAITNHRGAASGQANAKAIATAQSAAYSAVPSSSASGSVVGASAAALASAIQSNHIKSTQTPHARSKRIFHGTVEVMQVSNGYVVNIASGAGYEYDTHIAADINEVNQIIMAAMVAFQLESK